MHLDGRIHCYYPFYLYHLHFFHVSLYPFARKQQLILCPLNFFSSSLTISEPAKVAPRMPPIFFFFIGTVTGGFRRGDANANGSLGIEDAIFGLNYLFIGGAAPPCFDATDVNDSGSLDITDVIGFLNYFFLNYFTRSINCG